MTYLSSREIGMCLCGDNHCHVYTSTEGRKLSSPRHFKNEKWTMKTFVFYQTNATMAYLVRVANYWWIFKRKSHNHFTNSILTEAPFPTKWDMSWIIHCSIQLTIILRSYRLLGLHDRIVALNSPYVESAGVNNRPSMLRLLLPRFQWVTDLV